MNFIFQFGFGGWEAICSQQKQSNVNATKVEQKIKSCHSIRWIMVNARNASDPSDGVRSSVIWWYRDYYYLHIDNGFIYSMKYNNYAQWRRFFVRACVICLDWSETTIKITILVKWRRAETICEAHMNICLIIINCEYKNANVLMNWLKYVWAMNTDEYIHFRISDI